MKSYEIENWAVRIIERVESQQPNEDSRVELKSDWPEPAKAARRIAGHANSAGGDPILWLIGVDQTSGVVGANHKEFSEWYAKVRATFDEMFAPPVIDLNIPWQGKIVVALVFETDRLPFVVRNPVFGKPDGGPVALEIPMRDGTTVHSATRRDLLRLLAPLQLIPDCELHSAQLYATESINKDNEKEWKWTLHILLFAIPRSQQRVIIPEYRCRGWFHIKKKRLRVDFNEIGLKAFENTLIKDIGEGISIEGPGVFQIEAKALSKAIPKTKGRYDELYSDVELSMTLHPVGTENSISINLTILPSISLKGEKGRWSFKLGHRTGIKLIAREISREFIK